MENSNLQIIYWEFVFVFNTELWWRFYAGEVPCQTLGYSLKKQDSQNLFGLGSNICSPAEVTKPAPASVQDVFVSEQILVLVGMELAPPSSQSSLSIPTELNPGRNGVAPPPPRAPSFFAIIKWQNEPQLEEPCQALLGVWAEGARLEAVPHSSQLTAMVPRSSLSLKCSYFVSDALQSVELHTTLPQSTCSPRWRAMEEELQWMGWTGQWRSTWRRRVSGR